MLFQLLGKDRARAQNTKESRKKMGKQSFSLERMNFSNKNIQQHNSLERNEPPPPTRFKYKWVDREDAGSRENAAPSCLVALSSSQIPDAAFSQFIFHFFSYS